MATDKEMDDEIRRERFKQKSEALQKKFLEMCEELEIPVAMIAFGLHAGEGQVNIGSAWKGDQLMTATLATYAYREHARPLVDQLSVTGPSGFVTEIARGGGRVH